MTKPLLEVEDLTIQYRTKDGPVTAVSDVNLSIHEGEYVGLVGESGCGKSTLAHAIIGGLDANGSITSGSIKYRGREIGDFTDARMNEDVRWKEISWIPQGAMESLDALQRVSQQAVEIARTHTDLSKRAARERFGEMFDVVGIDRARIDDYPHQFSGGMKQRVLIALSLFLEPSLVIADEPTTALDVIMQDSILAHLDELKDELDVSLLLITHDISLVFENCDRVAIMHGGQLVETGSVRDVYYTPNHPYSILLQRSFPDIRRPDRKLEVIDGHPPQTYGSCEYCTFVDRCPLAVEECRERAPALQTVDGSDGEHAVACFRSDDVDELDATSDAGRVGTDADQGER